MKANSVVAFALALALSMACGQHDTLPVPRQINSATDLDDVRVALLVRLRQEAILAAPDAAGATCIVTESRSVPSARLLTLLSGRGLHLKHSSRCAPRNGRFVDAIDGVNAVILALDSVSLTKTGQAYAYGTYGLGGLWCGGGGYLLEFRLGEWEATPQGARIVC